MDFYPRSIRAKLTLTAVTVMGVLFVILGGVVEVVGRDQIMGGVDSELLKRATETIQVHNAMERDRPPPRDRDQGGPGPGPDDGPDGGPKRPGDGPGEPRQNGKGPKFQLGGNGMGGPGRSGGRDRLGGFQRAIQRLGDPLLSIGPRFVSITPGPPFAPPDMMMPYDKSVIELTNRRGVVYSNILLGTEKVRLISKLAIDDNGRRWVVQYPYPLGDIDKALKKLNQTLLLLLPFGLAMTAAACLFLMKRIMRPIREIRETADSIHADKMSQRLKVNGSDEFAQLAQTMNGMLGRIDFAFTAQRQALERLETILKQQRRFTADASHELKTPLAVIKANTGLMLHGMSLNDDERNSVTAIDQAAGRMNKLVQGLMVLARAESGQSTQALKEFNLALAVQNGIDQVYRPACKVISYESDDDVLTIKGCESDIERVFVNLLDNACRHTEGEGRVLVRVIKEGNEAVVSVTDNGEGIAAEHVEHLFDRFYRVDSSRSTESGGTGLGLAICKGIVETHGGKITIVSEPVTGTTVTVRLPLNK